MSAHPPLVQLDDLLAAQRLIAGRVNHTPILTSASIGEQLGVKLYFKAEVFQKTGSFKVRGALNKLHHLTDAEKQQGVITISSGNHAAALAYAGTLLGIQTTAVMPETAAASKVEATRRYGGNPVLHGMGTEFVARALELQKERNLAFVPPFDDLLIIAGQGTAGLELMADVPTPDVVIVPVGGGGLIAGVAAAVKSRNPATQVVGVEPVGASAMTQSLEKNEVVHLDKTSTIADGLAAPFAGEHTLRHVQHYVDQMVLVTDDEIMDALRLILERCKVMVEPAAAASLAALLHQKVIVKPGATVVCVLSGGNIDRSRLKDFL